MKGIVFLGDRKLELMDFPDPTPGPRDVVLEIKASGMCGTDLGLYRRSADVASASGPLIAGHEPCGIVAAVGSAVSEREASVGDRVMDHHYEGCGVCRHCKSGWTQQCLEGAIVYGNRGGHGAHAKYMKVPAHTLVPLPDDLSFESGAAIACGTGTAYGALKRLALEGDETIAIFGQGPVGLSGTQLAAAMGARVIAVDLSAERRNMALARGADVAIDPAANDPIQAIRDLTHGEGADKSLDATSSPEARRNAVLSIRKFGTACFVGIGGGVTFEVGPDLIRRQITRSDIKPFPRWVRPTVPASSRTGRSTSTASLRTSGGWSRPKRRTGSSISKRPEKASSCRDARPIGLSALNAGVK